MDKIRYLIYLNSFGSHNIVVTKTTRSGDRFESIEIRLPSLNVLILNAHLWIEDNKVMKCHHNIYKEGDLISDQELSQLGIDLTQANREKKLNFLVTCQNSLQL